MVKGIDDADRVTFNEKYNVVLTTAKTWAGTLGAVDAKVLAGANAVLADHATDDALNAVSTWMMNPLHQRDQLR